MKKEVHERISRFQKHCKQNVKSNCSYWPAELERHLEGETLKAFRFLKDKEDNYKDLKKIKNKWKDWNYLILHNMSELVFM